MDCRRTANLRVGEWLTNHFDLIVNYCNLVFARGELIVGKADRMERVNVSLKNERHSCATRKKNQLTHTVSLLSYLVTRRLTCSYSLSRCSFHVVTGRRKYCGLYDTTAS